MNRRKGWVVAMALVLAILAAGAARANNLTITNMTVTPKDNTTAFVQFDISWENSWRYTNINHDAAWVFFKVQEDNEGDMSDTMHVILEGTGINPTNYVVGTGTPIEMIVPTDRVGMIVRRSGEGVGTLNATGVKAVWNFASNGIPKTSKVKLQAFGVEMVYVAEGDFAAGSGGSENSAFTLTTINTADATVAPSGTGSKGGAGGGYPTGQTAPDNASWPNGYAAFYCMKYEITQGQYADFLNTLPRSQQATRCSAVTLDRYMGTTDAHTAIQSRNTVQVTLDPGGSAPREYTASRRDRACNYISWADGAAFADWAGLRPMTELEYEKACRGPLAPVANEYAWGTATIMGDVSRTISGTENGTERITTDTSSGGCNYGNKAHTGGDAGSGPLRAGIFATNGATRVSAGASYWGIMELSGNLWERSVTVGHATGRDFTGLHGNGVLNAGDADVLNWPGTDANGVGSRGAGWTHASEYARVSDRAIAAYVESSRYTRHGWRGVRSAPSGVGR